MAAGIAVAAVKGGARWIAALYRCFAAPKKPAAVDNPDAVVVAAEADSKLAACNASLTDQPARMLLLLWLWSCFDV